MTISNPKGGGGAAGLQSSTNSKNTYFKYIMISKVLRDLPFTRNHPLKSADDKYIRILKNKFKKFKKTKKLGHGD
jgi:hypothetical protein